MKQLENHYITYKYCILCYRAIARQIKTVLFYTTYKKYSILAFLLYFFVSEMLYEETKFFQMLYRNIKCCRDYDLNRTCDLYVAL